MLITNFYMNDDILTFQIDKDVKLDSSNIYIELDSIVLKTHEFVFIKTMKYIRLKILKSLLTINSLSFFIKINSESSNIIFSFLNFDILTSKQNSYILLKTSVPQSIISSTYNAKTIFFKNNIILSTSKSLSLINGINSKESFIQLTSEDSTHKIYTLTLYDSELNELPTSDCILEIKFK